MRSRSLSCKSNRSTPDKSKKNGHFKSAERGRPSIRKVSADEDTDEFHSPERETRADVDETTENALEPPICLSPAGTPSSPMLLAATHAETETAKHYIGRLADTLEQSLMKLSTLSAKESCSPTSEVEVAQHLDQLYESAHLVAGHLPSPPMGGTRGQGMSLHVWRIVHWLEREHAVSSAKLRASASSLRTSQDDLQDARASLASLDLDFQTLQQKYHHLQETHHAVAGRKEELEKELSRSLEMLERRKVQVSEGSEEGRRLSNLNVEAEAQAQRLSLHLDAEKGRANNLALANTELELRSEELQRELYLLQTELSKAQHQVSSTTEELEKKARDIQETSQALIKSEASVRATKGEFGSVESRLEAERRVKEELESRLEKTEAQAQEQSKKLSMREIQLRQSDLDCTHLNTQMLELKAKLEDREKQLSHASEESTRIRAECDKTQAELRLETAPNPIFVLDQLGKLVLWNCKAASSTGLPREEVLGTHLQDLLHEENLKADLRSAIGKVLSGQEKRSLSLRVDGREWDAQWTLNLAGLGHADSPRLLGEVLHTKQVEKSRKQAPGAVHASSTGDEVEDAMQKAISEGAVQVDVKRVDRGIYMIGGARRNITVKNSKIMVRVGGGYQQLDEFLSHYSFTSSVDHKDSGFSAVYAKALSSQVQEGGTLFEVEEGIPEKTPTRETSVRSSLDIGTLKQAKGTTASSRRRSGGLNSTETLIPSRKKRPTSSSVQVSSPSPSSKSSGDRTS